MLGFIALAGLFAAPSFSLSSPSPAHAQANSPPEFPSTETGARSVDENTPPYQNIGAPVTATDSDDTRLVYTLENARTSPFTIVRATGQLQVGQPLDHEDEDTYTVKVIVTDPDGATDTITVTINVNNLDEDGSISLTWTKPQVGAAITATLTDPDGPVSGITWQWGTSSSQNGTYTNLSDNGADSATYTPQSGDVHKYLRATASYSDPIGSGKTAHSAAGYVKPVPNPNQTPDFRVNTSGGYSCDDYTDESAQVCVHIKRSAPAGSSIYYPGYVHITDHDQVRYSLGGTDATLFRLDPVRGTLFTTEAHVYDNPGTDGKFVITITATDPSGLSDSIDVALRPSGGAGPPVVNGPSKITYPENGTWSLATYTASAANREGVSRPIEGWIIAVQPGGGDGDFFDIDDDGNLTFTQPPDYEDPADDNRDNTYSFSLHVYDTNPPNSGRPAQTFFNVSVTVTDETGEVSEISGPTVVDYAEHRTDEVATYAFTLQGLTAPAEWSLSGADSGEFTLSSSGVLTFNRPPDYENPTDAAGENAYLVTITAYKGSESKTEFVRVRVTDVNEPPEFDEGNTATRSVDRSASVNQVFGALVKATDPDGDVLTYTLETDQLFPFDIERYTGQLYVSEALDDAQSSYTVSVSVSDGEDADSNTDTSADDRITVTINVTGDQNDAPEFPSTETGARSIPENTTGVQNVGVPVAASDADTGDTLTYTLGGTDSGSFTIVGTSGQIQTKSGETYDHEAKPSYSVTVTATDTADAFDTQNVAITVTNVEEDGTVTLSPTQPTARSPVTASLTDLDGGVTGTSWQWARSNTQNGSYTNISGATSDSYTPPDTDVNYYLRATASYTDGHSANKTAKAETASAVQTGTNRPPTFDDGQITTRQVAEDAAANTNVGDVVGATDPDTGNTLVYSLIGTDAGSFAIDTGTGQIKVETGTTLDYEAVKNNYTVIVQVHDGKDVGGTADTAIDASIIVTINVTNVEERGTVALSMTHPSARAEITATLTDPDGRVTNESWQWAKSSTAQGAYTDIGNATSAIYTPADEDVGEFLRAKVSYEDDHGQNKTAEAVSANAVQAGANRPPTFASGTVTREVAENSGADVNVGSPVTATDLDTGNTLTYTLEGTDKDSFKIVSDSGQIQTKLDVTYDYETKQTYSVTVTAADGNDGTATKPVTINVTDVEEAGTVALSMTHPSARTKITATLTDPDGVVTGKTWVWARSDTQDGTYATIAGETSATYTPDDGDLGKFLKATATYTDRRPGTGKTAEGVSDNAVGAGTNRAPEFPDTSTTREFPENTLAGLPVGIPVGATDADANDVLEYTLEGTDAASFEIVPTDGQIKTKDGVTYDHEDKDRYSVTVKVDDKNSGTDTIAVTINVTDVNEKPAFTATEPVTFNIAENTSANTNIGTPVRATDPDHGDTLFYSLDRDSAAIFNIDSSNGQLKTKAALDKETKGTYTVTVSVRDSRDVNGNGDTENDANIGVTINVTDVNEPPQFPSTETRTRNVTEGTGTNQAIGNPVAADDPDVDASLTYTWEGPTPRPSASTRRRGS